MATFPRTIDLRYRVSTEWLEKATLDGHVVMPNHTMSLRPAELKPDLRSRVASIAARFADRRWTLEVFGSGVRPQDMLEVNSDDPPSAVDPVVRAIGLLPSVAEPTDDVNTVLDAYETWLDSYVALSRNALREWVSEYARDSVSEQDARMGIQSNWWQIRVPWRSESGNGFVSIDGRKDFDAFWRIRGAWQKVKAADSDASAEDLEFVEGVIKFEIELSDAPESADELVAPYVDLADRYARLLNSYRWNRTRSDVDFEAEMDRWAERFGSERLRIGIEDGYRMIPVYLEERISREAPHFFASPRKARRGSSWQPRTAPSELALTLRRRVYERLEATQTSDLPTWDVEIVWLKDAPVEMCTGKRWAVGFDDEPVDTSVPVEALVIPEWLGRYDLIGVIPDPTTSGWEFIKPEFRVLPSSYGVEGMDYAVRTDDIPF